MALDFEITNEAALKGTAESKEEEGQLDDSLETSPLGGELDGGTEDPLVDDEPQEQEPSPEQETSESGEVDEFLEAIEAEEKVEPTGEEEKKTAAEFLKGLGYKADGAEQKPPETLEELKTLLSAGKHMTQKSMQTADRERELQQQLQLTRDQLFQAQQAQQQPVQHDMTGIPDKVPITEEMMDTERILAENQNRLIDTMIAERQDKAQMKNYLNAQTSNANAARLHSEYEHLREDYGLPAGDADPETRDVVMGYLWACQQTKGVDYYGNPNFGVKDAIEDVSKLINSSKPDWDNFDYGEFLEKDRDAALKIGKSFHTWYRNRKKQQEGNFKSPKKVAPVSPPEEGEEEDKTIEYTPGRGGFSGLMDAIGEKAMRSKILNRK